MKISYNTELKAIEKNKDHFEVTLGNGDKIQSEFVLNATYASVNQIQNMLEFEPFKIKYELCEIILCDVAENLKGTGLTVMDGPFFSIFLRRSG